MDSFQGDGKPYVSEGYENNANLFFLQPPRANPLPVPVAIVDDSEQDKATPSQTMASTSGSKPASRFSSFKVFKFSGSSSKPPAPPPKDPDYLYSSAQASRSVLSLSAQSLSVADSFSQPSTPHSTAYQPSQYQYAGVRSSSPTPSRANQSQSSGNFAPESAGFKKGFIKSVANSMGKRGIGSSKSPARSNTQDSLSSNGAGADIQGPPDMRDDESISLPWGFQV